MDEDQPQQEAVNEGQPANVNEEQPEAANENQQEATDEAERASEETASEETSSEETASEETAEHEDRHRTRIFDYDKARRLEQEAHERWQAERTAFLQNLMCGPDVMSWIAPKDGVVADEVLREHMAQLQNVVRYALQYAVADGELLQLSLSAATTATNMIRANIALAKALAASNSKTVRGVRRKKAAQD